MSFFHLHSHTEYSIADGLFSPKAWAKAIKGLGLKGHAITDHGTMGGVLPFYHAMREEKLTPLLGCEFYFNQNPTLKDAANRKSNHLILIAKDYGGWQNMLKLQKLSYTEGFYFKPRVGLEWLAAHKDGLVCLTACLGGALSQEVWNEQEGKITLGLEARFKQLHAIFGDDFYVEFQGHDDDSQKMMNKTFYDRLHALPGFKPVATNDCHFILEKHHPVQGLVKGNAYGNAEAAESFTAFKSCYLKTGREVYESFRRHHDLPQAMIATSIQSTEEVFDKCANFEFPKSKHYLPRYSATVDSGQLFKEMTTKALAKFLIRKDIFDFATRKEYVDRFAKEYRVITKYGLQDYFLIVWDIVRFARESGIYSGIGRGSSAGSFICYLLDIVKVNPLQYKLLFERMLNENRCENGELPDIDLDFESERRGEIKDYIFERYGREFVCEIGTYGRLKLKSSIIDFGKQFKISHAELLKITTSLQLDKEESQSLEAAMKDSSQLKTFMDRHPDYKFAVESLNGQVKSQSVHPAGVLICSEPIDTVTPLKTQKAGQGKGSERVIVTQAEDKYVIGQGLVKMDILGLKEYDVFKYVIERSGCGLTANDYISKIHGMEMEKSDEKVWEFFREGKTDAVFQFSSDGMKALLIGMQADSINDLIAAVALYRPGCIANGWHTQYCRRKHGEEEVIYPHPDLEKTLADTYGVIVFQEQFMEVFNVIGGIPLSDADTIRSALGKKDEAKLNKFKATFVTGAAVKLGSEEAAEELWDQVVKASGYTFNRSHSAVYALVAYISQWFKVHHPAEFWAAVLGWDARKNKWDDLVKDKKAASDMGIVAKPPDVSTSGLDFSFASETGGSLDECLGGQVTWSLCGVKGIGDKTAQEIINQQPFKSFEDFYGRVHKAKVKFDSMEALVYAGGFDTLGDRREMLVELYRLKNLKAKGDKIKKMPALSDTHMMFEFYNVMGFFEQKLKDVFEGFSRVGDGSICAFTEDEVAMLDSQAPVIVGGMLSDITPIKTRNGEAMGRAKLLDLDEDLELTFFPRVWSSERTKIRKGFVVEIQGKKSNYNGKKNLIDVESIQVISKS